MNTTSSAVADRIYGFTKFVAALLGAVVLYAFIVLYFFPTQTKHLFAWPIAPPMTAMLLPRRLRKIQRRRMVTVAQAA